MLSRLHAWSRNHIWQMRFLDVVGCDYRMKMIHSPRRPSTRAVRVDSIANRRPSATTRPSAADD
ncbi:hypothetical protein HanRHA438_Chr08g0357771 [Helianthus annuus]|nr:hypothetical protein HanRHA438_Chr08g0357771 [Helianthus annuus]